MHDISSPSPLSPDEDSRDLIQQSIDILHSSSSEEDEEEKKEEGFFQAIARRMTPKATPSTASTHKTRVVNRRHTIATADTQPIAKTLVFQGIDEVKGFMDQGYADAKKNLEFYLQNHTRAGQVSGGWQRGAF